MRLHGICVYVDDVPSTLAFYGRGLGFETRHFDEELEHGVPPAEGDGGS